MAAALGDRALISHCLSRRLLARIGAILAIACLPSAARGEIAAEAAVKAAVIFNLLTFIHWPKDEQVPGKPAVLCLLEESGTGRELSGFSGKTLHGSLLNVRRIPENAEELERCLAVFVESTNPSALARAALVARTRPLLVIGEGAWALERGAMIGVSVVGSRVTFDVNLASLKQSHLAASSKLLRLARTLVE